MKRDRSIRVKLARIWNRLRHFRDDGDLQEELRTHIELLTEDHLATGLPEMEAARRARVRVSNPRAVIEKVRDQEFITIFEDWHRDFLLGIRALRESPVFSITAIVTLGLGIGVNTAIFTLLYGLLLRSLPVTDAHQLARIRLVGVGLESRESSTAIPWRMVQQLREQQTSFTDISGWLGDRVSMEENDGSLRFYNADLVSGNAFQVLGMKPYLGRLISESDDIPGGSSSGWPVVLSYGLWKDRFGGAPEIVGKPIRLSNTVATVIGVTPPDFHGLVPGMDVKLFMPLQFFPILEPGAVTLDSPDTMIPCYALGRLKPGVSFDRARAEIAVYRQQLLETLPPRFRDSPFFQKAVFRLDSARTGLPSFFGRTYSEPLYLMQGLAGIALLLCCVNVGGLMMARVYSRRQEFAVRSALGAGRWRLIRQYLTESFVLASTGAALGAVFAWYGNHILLRFFRHPMLGEWMEVKPDWTVLLATGLCALLTTVAFGMLPALRASGIDPASMLKSRTAGMARRIGGCTFVPVQVALSLTLVTVAMLLSQSLARLRGEPTGFDADHVTIQTAPFNLLHKQGDARLDLHQRMVDRIGQEPGVESAAMTWMTPVTGIQATATFRSGSGAASSADDSRMAYNEVGPGYFRTMKTRIISGREFEQHERDRSVCVVNQSAADFLFPRQQALGASVIGANLEHVREIVNCRVVGIAEDAKFGSLRESPPRTIYFPVTTATGGNLVFLINSVNKTQSVAAYRKALSELAPTIPLVIFVTLKEQMDAALGSQSLITVMSKFFGGLAMLLSAIGLYGLLASNVAQRRGEIGLRIALGARRGRVLWMVLSDALRLVGIGVLLGLGTLLLALRIVRDLLYGVSGFELSTWVEVSALLASVAFVAALIPALRAATVDPIQTLRAE